MRVVPEVVCFCVCVSLQTKITTKDPPFSRSERGGVLRGAQRRGGLRLREKRGVVRKKGGPFTHSLMCARHARATRSLIAHGPISGELV